MKPIILYLYQQKNGKMKQLKSNKSSKSNPNIAVKFKITLKDSKPQQMKAL